MKSTEKETKRNLTAAELASELRKSEEKLFKLQFKHRSAALANPLELRTLRRDVARLQTWISQKKQPAAPAAKAKR